MAEKRFAELLGEKRIAVLGFGREGRSTLRRLHQYLPDASFRVCDINRNAADGSDIAGYPDRVEWFLGSSYLEGLRGCDHIIKSPGIPYSVFDNYPEAGLVTSQTELFLRILREQVTGITGTKGKSTTASLLYHILRTARKKVVFAGNIGVPCFDLLDEIDPATHIVFEMSSHQLQEVSVSPHIAVLLNLFREHLDHYRSYEEYQQAKMNIARWQGTGDYLIANATDPEVHRLMEEYPPKARRIALGKSVSPSGMHAYCRGNDFVFVLDEEHLVLTDICNRIQLPGRHNVMNALAAMTAALLHNVSEQSVSAALSSFGGLPHRLEYVGTYNGVRYYNDSIATVPEATVEAVRSFSVTRTLILGGMDRGLDYRALLSFLGSSGVERILLTGEAGKRIREMARGMKALNGKQLVWFSAFDDAVRYAVKNTVPGTICLLSPAAASYDAFKNFEERGERFKQLVKLFSG